MSSTDDFTNKDILGLADRKLILFLIVALIDERECLTAAYQAVLAKWSTMEGHWAYGKDLNSMQKSCAKHLGKSAEKRPPWRKMLDTIQAALPPNEAAEVLAIATGLFCQAKNITRPEGYDGEISQPPWAAPEVERVTVDMIRAWRGDNRLVGAQQAVSRQVLSFVSDPSTVGSVSDTERLKTENAMLRQLLDTMTRAFRIRDRDCRTAEDSAQKQWSDQKVLAHRTRVATAEAARLRQDNDDVRQRLDALAGEHLRVLRLLHPAASEELLQKLLDATIKAEKTGAC